MKVQIMINELRSKPPMMHNTLIGCSKFLSFCNDFMVYTVGYYWFIDWQWHV